MHHPLLAYPENNETITGLVFYGRMHYLGFWAGVACYYYFGLVTATQKQDHKQVGLLLFLFYIKMSREKNIWLEREATVGWALSYAIPTKEKKLIKKH